MICIFDLYFFIFNLYQLLSLQLTNFRLWARERGIQGLGNFEIIFLQEIVTTRGRSSNGKKIKSQIPITSLPLYSSRKLSLAGK